MAGDESTSHALLGLLSIEPMSGYDMRRHLKISMSYFWSESFGQIYPALMRLTAEGLIEATATPAKGKRKRKVYSLTAAGQNALSHWLGLPPRTRQPRDEFLLKLFLGASAPDGAIRDHIASHRIGQEAALTTYRDMREFVGRERRDFAGQKYWMLQLDRAIALRVADIAWCDEALAVLDAEAGNAVRSSRTRPAAG